MVAGERVGLFVGGCGRRLGLAVEVRWRDLGALFFVYREWKREVEGWGLAMRAGVFESVVREKCGMTQWILFDGRMVFQSRLWRLRQQGSERVNKIYGGEMWSWLSVRKMII